MSERNYTDVTDAEVKAEYEKTPAVNQYHTWEQVKEFPALYLLLKRQVALGLVPSGTVEMQAIATPKTLKTAFVGVLPRKPAPGQKRSIFLRGKHLDQINTALRFARNCLQCPGLNDSIKAEALRELSTSQHMLDKYTRTKP